MRVVEPEERYPKVPNPRTVLVIILFKPTVLTNPACPKPTIVEVSSVGSINDEISVCSPIAVEFRVLAKNGVLTKSSKVER